MKSKVKLSQYALILTFIVNIALIIGCVLTFNKAQGFYIILSVLILLNVMALLYGPVAVESDSKYVTVKTMLRKHRIPIRNVESVELFQPTMGAYRLFASGGFFGYWGLFREGDIGRYAAYYGKASDCFLIRMKNGDKYVLGCADPSRMVSYIQSQIS